MAQVDPAMRLSHRRALISKVARWVEKEVCFHYVMGDWSCVTRDERRVRTDGKVMLQVDALAAHQEKELSGLTELCQGSAT